MEWERRALRVLGDERRETRVEVRGFRLGRDGGRGDQHSDGDTKRKEERRRESARRGGKRREREREHCPLRQAASNMCIDRINMNDVAFVALFSLHPCGSQVRSSIILPSGRPQGPSSVGGRFIEPSLCVRVLMEPYGSLPMSDVGCARWVSSSCRGRRDSAADASVPMRELTPFCFMSETNDFSAARTWHLPLCWC